LPVEIWDKLGDEGEDWIGLVFAMYSIGFLIASFTLAKLMEKLGWKLLHVSALLLLSLGHAGIVFTHYAYENNSVSNKFSWSYLIVLFICWFFIGVGSATVQVTSFAMVSSLFPDKVSIYVARIELALGVGLMLGPALGTGLYALGGYVLPNWFFVGLFLIEFIAGIIVLPGKRLSSKKKIKEEEKIKKMGKDPKIELKKWSHLWVSYSKLILNKGSFFALMTITVDLIEWTFLDPILTARFDDEGISEVLSGLSFLCSSIPYAISCYFMHHFEKIFGYKTCL